MTVAAEEAVQVEVNTWSLELPFAEDSESSLCEWCSDPVVAATHWTQAEADGHRKSRSFFHCKEHQFNAQRACLAAPGDRLTLTREQVLELVNNPDIQATEKANKELALKCRESDLMVLGYNQALYDYGNWPEGHTSESWLQVIEAQKERLGI